MNGRDRIVLRKMLAYISEAFSYTCGMDFDSFTQEEDAALLSEFFHAIFFLSLDYFKE